MSRRRPAPSIQRIEQDAQDVLAGRVSPGAGELLECIHAINPTGRSLGPAEERRRYELKARLQSLLIRRFHDDLVVTAEAGGVIAIRHRYLGQDACHARLDELDDDARARMRWLLDVAEVADPAPPGRAAQPSSPPASDTGPLEQGRAALAEFDYDAARAHFERAALGASGDPVAARELLELLVDHLVLDEEALAIEHQLPRSAAGDAEVRALLAVAAARTGDAAAADRLLNGLVVPRAADAWCALAQHAITRQACDDLDRCIARLTGCDPAHPEIIRLRERAGQLRADARRPAEQELLRIAEAGDDAAIEAMARDVLTRWPDSPVAGRILGQIQDRRRAGEAERLITGARAALSNGELARATELCRHARAAGADTTTLLAQIAAADLARRRAHDDAEVAAVSNRLADADPRPGLAAYLALEPELRRRIRSTCDLPMLEWLEQATPHNKGGRHGALIDAVLAIAAAAAALADSDDARSLAILDSHAAVIAGVPRASELRAEAHRRIAAFRRATAISALEQARLALAGDDLDLCARLCDQLDRRDLDDVKRTQLDEARRQVRERRDVVRRRARIDDLAASGDLVAAVRELDGLLAAGLVTGDHVAASRARLDGLRTELRRTWCVRSDDAGERRVAPDPVGELLGQLPYTEACAPWLIAGGAELVIATAEGRHVFLGRVSVDDGRLLDRRYLRAPEPLGALLSATVDGDTLWLAGDAGRVLQVSWTTGEPVRWSSLAPFLATSEQIDRVFLIPGSSHLWLEAGVRGDGLPTDRVIEVEPWRVRREIPTSRSLHTIVAGGSSCVIGLGAEGGAVRYTERGAVAEEITACTGMHISAATTDPGGELVVLGSRSDDGGEIEILRTSAGRTIHRQTVPDSSTDRTHHCATARGSGLFVLHYSVDYDESRLAVLRFTESDLAPVYTVSTPTDLLLVQDVDSTQVVALWDSSRRMEVTRIGAQPPRSGDAPMTRFRWFVPAVAGDFPCAPTGGETPDARRLDAADAAAERGDWREVRSLLEGVPPDSVAPGCLDHHCHLLGLAWLRTGVEAARARELWQLGHAREGEGDSYFSCRLDTCLDLVEPLPEPLPDAWWSDEASVVRQLRGAIATADKLLAAHDPRAALHVMRRRAVTRTGELQSTARLAAAWLAIDPDPVEDCFDKAIALARFVVLAARHALDLPIEGAWGPDRLTALVDSAERWLSAWHDRV